MQPDLFDAPPPIVGPLEPVSAPFRGNTPLTRATSESGARHACEARSANIVAMRQLFREPHTLNEIATLLKVGVSSACSLRAAIADELEEVDAELVEWGNGRRSTWRTRWRLKQR